MRIVIEEKLPHTINPADAAGVLEVTKKILREWLSSINRAISVVDSEAAEDVAYLGDRGKLRLFFEDAEKTDE